MSKRITCIGLLLAFAFTIKAQNNLVINGSFEQNSITSSCFEAMNAFAWNSTVDYSTSFAGMIALVKDSCPRCPSGTFWGGGAQNGHWFSFLKSQVYYNQPGTVWINSKQSLQLSSALSNEKNYILSFYLKDPPPAPPIDTPLCDDPLNNFIRIGISNSPTNFGTLIYQSPLGDSIWTQYSIVFNTQNTEEYLTVEVGTGDTNNYGVFVDNFVLEETNASAINEVNSNNRNLLKIVDILGKESSPNKKGLLFYIYSDGTVEKRITVEQ